jgi:membrane-associated HD superfamily phosphohydrolase
MSVAAIVSNNEYQAITTIQIASGSVIHKRDTSFDTILHTTASMAVMVAVAVAVAAAVAAVATIAVAVAMGAVITETVKAAAEVQQQPKREHRDQAAINSITAFVRLVPAPIYSLASAPRLLLRYSYV